jgi:hypothetical protein
MQIKRALAPIVGPMLGLAILITDWVVRRWEADPDDLNADRLDEQLRSKARCGIDTHMTTYNHTPRQQELHRAFLTLWDKAVGTKGYDKAQWMELDTLLRRSFRAQDEQLEFQRGIMADRDMWKREGLKLR